MTQTPLRDAATVLLVRDTAAGLEVFMVRRHPRIEFASGALVFPGGAVDESDRHPRIEARLPRSARRLDERERAWRAAAIREAYEECGVLLARRARDDAPLGAARLAEIDERYAEERAAHRLDIGTLAEREGLVLGADALVPFAHWITPAARPKRFDTRFYLAAAPADQDAAHDGHEAVESIWRPPAQVCAEADEGCWHLRFPTRMTLEKLARSAGVADALAEARRTPVVTVETQIEMIGGERRVRIPVEAGYGLCEAVLDEEGRLLRRG